MTTSCNTSLVWETAGGGDVVVSGGFIRWGKVRGLGIIGTVMSEKLALQDGDRIAVVGAGPAGSLFAYCVLHLARQVGLKVEVTLYDPRDFRQARASGCNQCAGVISESLYQRLKRIGIEMDVAGGPIRSLLRGYVWHTEAGRWVIDAPSDIAGIRTVFRGQGPRQGDTAKVKGYDYFLLEKALAAGARYRAAGVIGIGPTQAGGTVRLDVHDNEGKNGQEQAELVVGAFGLSPLLLNDLTVMMPDFKRPRWIRAAQAELSRADGAIRQSDQYIQIFNIGGRDGRQLVVTPKSQYATLTLLSNADLGAADLCEIKTAKAMAAIRSSGWEWPADGCSCLPRLATRGGRNFVADRLLLVGDAACCRYFKNGLETALRTAELAAAAVVYQGVDRASLRRSYYKEVRQEIITDNFYGRLLLSVHRRIWFYPVLTEWFLVARLTLRSKSLEKAQQSILWNMLTGNLSYKRVFYRIVGVIFCWPAVMWLLRELGNLACSRMRAASKVLRGWWGNGGNRISERLGGWAKIPGRWWSEYRANRLRKQGSLAPVSSAGTSRALCSGERVAIVGGGPAGTSCAIKLMHLAAREGVDLAVTIYEPTDFSGAVSEYQDGAEPYHDMGWNQCVGVLSPPIYEILTKRLEVEFPNHLVQRYIIGYQLHGQRETTMLDEPEGASYVLRRITFDDYMMAQAQACGVQVISGEVSNIERLGRGFRVVSSGGVAEAEAVVGAFGATDQAGDVFERCFGYRRPEFMQTVITKRHPEAGFLDRFGLCIHAFLPRLREVEFGAVTPKHNHLAINIAGRRVDEQVMHDFLALAEVKRLLPAEYQEKGREMYFRGRFPMSPAGNLFADGMVMVGDASGMLRPFKGKGINAAILSGCAAAEVMMYRGLSAVDFERHYYLVFRQIVEDIWYARAARWMTNFMANTGGMDVALRASKQSPLLRQALTGAVSGDRSYKTIARDLTRGLWSS